VARLLELHTRRQNKPAKEPLAPSATDADSASRREQAVDRRQDDRAHGLVADEGQRDTRTA
jgi:hypothetical protein